MSKNDEPAPGARIFTPDEAQALLREVVSRVVNALPDRNPSPDNIRAVREAVEAAMKAHHGLWVDHDSVNER